MNLSFLLSFFACSDNKSTPDEDCSSYTGAFLGGGTATLSGTMQYPADLDEGLFIEIGLQDDFAYYGSLPTSFVDAQTCGAAQTFSVSEAPDGDYSLLIRAQSAEQPADEEADTLYDAIGSMEISIEEGNSYTDLVITLE